MHFSSLIPNVLMFTLATFCLTTSNLPWFIDLIFQVPMQYCSLQLRLYIHHETHPQLSIVSALAQPLHSFWSHFCFLPQLHIGYLQTWGAYLPLLYLFDFSYCSWDSWGKNTEVVFHSLLQWTTFRENSPLWPVYLGWPCMAWLIASLSYTSLWSV